MRYFIALTIAIVSVFSISAQRERVVKKAPASEKPVIIKTSAVRPVEGMVFTATAYSLRGITASGEGVREGIIAADPKVLPLGTVVYIEGMGEFVVKDTGGVIKGNKIDIWMPSTAKAIQFGKKKVKVRVISKPDKKKGKKTKKPSKRSKKRR